MVGFGTWWILPPSKSALCSFWKVIFIRWEKNLVNGNWWIYIFLQQIPFADPNQQWRHPTNKYCVYQSLIKPQYSAQQRSIVVQKLFRTHQWVTVFTAVNTHWSLFDTFTVLLLQILSIHNTLVIISSKKNCCDSVFCGLLRGTWETVSRKNKLLLKRALPVWLVLFSPLPCMCVCVCVCVCVITVERIEYLWGFSTWVKPRSNDLHFDYQFDRAKLSWAKPRWTFTRVGPQCTRPTSKAGHCGTNAGVPWRLPSCPQMSLCC